MFAVLGCVALILAGTSAPLAVAGTSPSNNWTIYHGDERGDGLVTSVTSVNTSSPRWVSPHLDGQLFGEPLVLGNRIYVATENDSVYALSATSGAVLWRTHVATPVAASALPCGDIAPTVGITGTPVIDAPRHEIFVVALLSAGGKLAHKVFGLSTLTGATMMVRDVDPPAAQPKYLLQRTGLNLDQGEVIFGFGGNSGDCGAYRGRVVSVGESGGPVHFFTTDSTANEREGAIWMGGAAPTVDAHGNIWVTVGNGSQVNSGDTYDNSDAILELSATLHLKQFFAPTSWATDNSRDADLSSSVALLADGEVIAAGKTGGVYLARSTHLGGIGGEQFQLPGACSNVIDGGTAVAGTTVYLPCVSGIIAVRVTPSARLTLLWRSSHGGHPAIVTANRVWTIGPSNDLDGLSRSNGALLQSYSLGSESNHFPTPSIGAGLLLAPASDQVFAFGAT